MKDTAPVAEIRIHDSLDSTMAEGARIAAGIAGPTWIFAHAQTAARGRRGRPWAMPPGNFAASLILRPEGGPREAALRSFVAALGLRDALIAAGVAPGDVALKWPNDVLLRGGKVAGILLESLGQGAQVDHLVIGFGVNLAAAPARDALEAEAVPPTALAEVTGAAPDPRAFLDLLAPSVARYEDQMATYGFAPIRTAWLQGAARLGETITARLSGGKAEMTGVFRDVDPDGNLVLDTGDGPRRIAAADVFF